MKIKYLGTRPRDVAPATGGRPFTVNPGDTIDVDAATGRSLLRQRRRFAEPPKRKKTAKKTATTAVKPVEKESTDG